MLTEYEGGFVDARIRLKPVRQNCKESDNDRITVGLWQDQV